MSTVETTPVTGTVDAGRVARARAKLAAARLRVKACQQDQYAAGYTRQAEHPIYPGQEAVCGQKAAEGQAFAAQTRAEADLIEAEAGL